MTRIKFAGSPLFFSYSFLLLPLLKHFVLLVLKLCLTKRDVKIMFPSARSQPTSASLSILFSLSVVFFCYPSSARDIIIAYEPSICELVLIFFLSRSLTRTSLHRFFPSSSLEAYKHGVREIAMFPPLQFLWNQKRKCDSKVSDLQKSDGVNLEI